MSQGTKSQTSCGGRLRHTHNVYSLFFFKKKINHVSLYKFESNLISVIRGWVTIHLKQVLHNLLSSNINL